MSTTTLVETPTKVTVTPADVLERTAYLFEEGVIPWCKAPAWPPTGSALCIGLAIHKVWGDMTGGWADLVQWHGQQVRAVVRLADWLGLNNVPKWNDSPGRTKREVVDLLRSRAAYLREHS